tara:strand:- start:1212 stop:1796 length:585 start_codon:yes stop_codon:yes gene_type:complete
MSLPELDENANQIMANIKELQNKEINLYLELEKTSNVGSKKDIINEISNVSQIRFNLLKNIEGVRSFVQKEVNKDISTLKDQLVAIDIMNKELDRLEKEKKIVSEKNIDLNRNLEIVRYYGKKYHAQIEILKVIVVLCIVVIFLNVLITKKIISSVVYLSVLTIVLFIGVFITLNKSLDIYRRSKTNYDRYNWN